MNKVDPLGLMLSDIGIVQTQDESYARTLQGASDAASQMAINAQYARTHLGYWNQLSSQQQRLFTTYYDKNIASKIDSNGPPLGAEMYWNLSVLTSNKGEGTDSGWDGVSYLAQDQLTTFIGVTSMWEHNTKGSVIDRIATVDAIERDNKNNRGFRIQGTFKEGGGEYIRDTWEDIGGKTKGRDGVDYAVSRRETGKTDRPNGQFTMTRDLKRFDSDVDYKRIINLIAHGKHSNSNILSDDHLELHIRRYGAVPIWR